MSQTNDPDDTPSGAGLPQPELAAAAVLRLLRPLARLMIDHGLQLPSMVELLKKALVDEAVASLTAAIEPLMIIFLGVLVGLIVAGMFLPLFKIIGTLSVQ